MDMSSRTQTVGLIAITALCLGVLGWVVFVPSENVVGAKRGEPTQPVVCANPTCGFTGELAASKLVSPPDARDIAREPANGPGYVCPKCGRNTLYPGLNKCPKCGAVYMPMPGAAETGPAKCPQCGLDS